MARTFLADGFRMVTAVSDLTALRTGLARELSAARAGHNADTTSFAGEQQCTGPGPHMRRLDDGTPSISNDRSRAKIYRALCVVRRDSSPCSCQRHPSRIEP